MAENNKSMGMLILDGFWGENPVLRLGLGLCPAIAVTITGYNGLAMGLAPAAVLVCSNLLISLLGRLFEGKARIPAFMVIIAGLATVAGQILSAWYPELCASMGIYVPLIAVNTLLLSRADTLAGEGNPVAAIADGIGMGLGYVCALTVLGVVRELFGFGTAFGQAVFGAGFDGNALGRLPAGGFLLLGLAMGIFNAAAGKRSNGKEDATT